MRTLRSVKLLGLLIVSKLLFLAVGAQAQQNFFNMPSGTITPKKGFFYQNQTNAYSIHEWEIKNHFMLGLGSGWEVGLNVLNMPLHIEKGEVEYEERVSRRGTRISSPLSSLLMLTAQKQLWKKGKWHQTIGAQIGTNWDHRNDYRHFSQFHYSVVSYEPKPGVHLAGGAYVSNAPFAGDGFPAGVMVGFEYPLIGHELVAMGDALISLHDIGATVLGLMYEIDEGVQVSLGVQFPNLPEGQEQKLGLVLELNLFDF